MDKQCSIQGDKVYAYHLKVMEGGKVTVGCKLSWVRRTTVGRSTSTTASSERVLYGIWLGWTPYIDHSTTTPSV